MFPFAPQPAPQMDAFQGRSPYGTYAGPRYTGPMNLSFPGPEGQLFGMAANQLLPMVLPQLLGTQGTVPTQFVPQQSFYDQMVANNAYAQQQRAMAQAARDDQRIMFEALRGAQEMATGRALTDAQRATTMRAVEGTYQMLPFATAFLGPDLVDQLHGRRGSSILMTQQIQQAMRTGIDPLTGRVGMSGDSAAAFSRQLYADLYGAEGQLAGMRGITAGRTGILLGELQQRGLLGASLGAMPLEERLGAMTSISDEQIARLAETIRTQPGGRSLADMRAANENVTQDMVDQARSQVRDSFDKMQALGPTLSASDIADLPGGEDLLRAGDAQRIGDRLKNLSGVVTAMQEIFGDAGHPNATMREIVNGLEALTQGGLATTGPQELEAIVRRTQALANQTGVSFEAQLGMMAQNAALADQLGVDRSFATRGTQYGVNYGAAAGDVLRLDVPTWGAITRDQIMMADQQLRMHAAASPLANQLGALMRMEDAGLLGDVAADSELAAYTAAVRAGDTEYEFTDAEGVRRRRSVAQNQFAFQEMLTRDAGVTETQSLAMLMDRLGNQEFIQKFDIDSMARKFQAQETARRLVAPTVASRLAGDLTTQGISQQLIDEGIVADEAEFRSMMDQVGLGVAKDFFAMDPATERNDASRRAALDASFREQLRSAIASRMPGATDEEIDAAMARATAGMGGQDALIDATLGLVASQNPLYGTRQGMFDLNSEAAFRQEERRRYEMEAEAMTRAALGGLAQEQPLQRMIEALRKAGPDTDVATLMGDMIGGVKMEELIKRDPGGQAAALAGLLDENRQLDFSDAEQREQFKKNLRMANAIIQGGEAAEAAMAELDAERPTLTAEEATPEQLQAALERLRTVEESERGDENEATARNRRNSIRLSKAEQLLAEGKDPSATLDLLAKDYGEAEGDAAGRLTYYQFRHAEELKKTADADLAMASRSEEELIAEAERRGLIKGDAPASSDVVAAVQKAALEGKSLQQVLLDEQLLSKEQIEELNASPVEAAQAADAAIEGMQQQPQTAAPANTTPAKIEVTMTGTFREEEDETVTVQGNGVGVGVAAGAASAVLGP